MRTCYRCGIEKPDEEFHRHPYGRGGRRNICKVCANRESSIRHAEWRKTHAANTKANMQRYLERHAEEIALERAIKRDGHLNAEEQRVYTRTRKRWQRQQWALRHPEDNARYANRQNMRRYARKRDAQGHATKRQIDARWDYYGRRCWICGAPATETDHVIPLTRGGSDWPANQRPCCARCNRSKGNRDHRRFLRTA